jgi:hypothetical protein
VRSTDKTSISGSTDVVLEPGVYRKGISISPDARVTLNPGIYIMQGGGFNISGNGPVEGDGVMIYNMVAPDGDHGQVLMSGNGPVRLTPPTSGPYKGIGIFQQRSQIDVVQISGNGNVQLTGVVYAASALVQLSGNGTTSIDTLGGSVVAKTLQVSGDGTFNVDLGGNLPSVARDVRLIE